VNDDDIDALHATRQPPQGRKRKAPPKMKRSLSCNDQDWNPNLDDDIFDDLFDDPLPTTDDQYYQYEEDSCGEVPKKKARLSHDNHSNYNTSSFYSYPVHEGVQSSSSHSSGGGGSGSSLKIRIKLPTKPSGEQSNVNYHQPCYEQSAPQLDIIKPYEQTSSGQCKPYIPSSTYSYAENISYSNHNTF